MKWSQKAKKPQLKQEREKVYSNHLETKNVPEIPSNNDDKKDLAG
jgi:hypothetical protein